jgi:hypothetical protein
MKNKDPQFSQITQRAKAKEASVGGLQGITNGCFSGSLPNLCNLRNLRTGFIKSEL